MCPPEIGKMTPYTNISSFQCKATLYETCWQELKHAMDAGYANLMMSSRPSSDQFRKPRVQSILLLVWEASQYLFHEHINRDALRYNKWLMIDVCKHGHHHLAIHSICNSSMTRNTIAKILYFKSSFKATCKKASERCYYWCKQTKT